MRAPAAVFATLCVTLGAAVFATLGAARAAEPGPAAPLCTAAASRAEARYALPPGLLLAIADVESGRAMAGAAGLTPWPWTVQAESQSHVFATKPAAIAWVQQAEAAGVTSIDVGCMQVNLMYHPAAFRSLADAFDPEKNVDYAARFLLTLHAATGDWREAAGRYHSETLALAIPYRDRVEAMLGSPLATPAETRLQRMQAAWAATLTQGQEGGQAGGQEADGGEGDDATAGPAALTGNWAALRPAPRTRAAPRHLPPPAPIMLSDAR